VPSWGKQEPPDRVLLAIGAFKLMKALVLIGVSFGALKLIDANNALALKHWASALHPGIFHDPLQKLIAYLTAGDDGVLTKISLLALVYAALFLVEGGGLCLRKRWAEYLTVIITGSLIPFEFYEDFRRLSLAKSLITIVNAACLWYLIRKIQGKPAESDRPPPKAGSR
jgi:uncharacterized membrane protein (DUF2068 family)